MLRIAATTLLASMLPLVAQQQQSNDSALVKQLLREDLGTRSFSFAEVIASSSGKNVIAYDTTKASHQAALLVIQQAAVSSIKTLNATDSPTRGLRRINEASRHFEEQLLAAIDLHPDFSCSIPENAQGRKLRSGYPDLLILHKPSKLIVYLDPKVFEKKSKASSFRTFYFEPRTRTLKIQHDALHLLLGIQHDGVDGNWTFSHPEVVDLSKLRVRLKAEFQASNRDLYRKALLIPAPRESGELVD